MLRQGVITLAGANIVRKRHETILVQVQRLMVRP